MNNIVIMSLDLQICLVLDYHRPMTNLIGGVKNQIEDIIDEVKSKYPMKTIEVAFVGYGGYFCVPPTERYDFTSDIKTFQHRLKNFELELCLGSDCRNVQEAYGLANGLPWYARKRIIIHMGNGPAFGPKYHNNDVIDHYTPGHPYLVLEEEVQKFARKNIDLIFIRLDERCDKMIKVIRENYLLKRREGFQVIDLYKRYNKLYDIIYDETTKYILGQFVQRVS